MHRQAEKYRKGFTLLELLVVIAIIGVLAGVIFASLTTTRQKSRDARRLEDMRQLRIALDLYLDVYSVYPDSDNQGVGGWDTGGDGDFIQALADGGYMRGVTIDPNNNTSNGNYRYMRYAPGAAGCDPARGGFYVIAVVDMESQTGPYPLSPGFSCTSRNWQTEFEWVAGKFEK